MRPSALLFAILVLLCAIPAAAVPPAATLCSSTSSHLAFSAGKTLQPDLRSPIFSPVGTIRYTDGGCTVTLDCPSGQQIGCMGSSSCSTTTVGCSSQGSTCPGQGGGSAGAVACDGFVQASCCPEVCFGCGASCTTNADCDAVCTCGSGTCFHGSCTCPF